MQMPKSSDWKRYLHMGEGDYNLSAKAFWAHATALYPDAFYSPIEYEYDHEFNLKAFQEIFDWNSRLGVDYMLSSHFYWQGMLMLSISLQDRIAENLKRYDDLDEFNSVLDIPQKPFDEFAVAEFVVWDTCYVFINLPDSELPKWEDFLEKHGYVVRWREGIPRGDA